MTHGGTQVLLPGWDDRLAWHKKTGAVTASEILRGDEDTALVVVLASSVTEPSRGDLQAMWHERAGRSADPVLVAVRYQHAGGSQVALLGVTSDAVPVMGVEESIAERLLAHALAQTSPSGLVTEMRRVLGSLHGGLGAGFRNEGLFATHVLDQQPSRSDWDHWCQRSVPLLTSRGSALLTALGYAVDPVPEGFVLRDPSGEGSRRAAAVLLTEDESLDNPLSKFHGSNAVTHGLALARREGVPWLVVMGGPVMRLFSVDPDVGVGRKGQTQTYAEIDLSLLADDKAGYLGLLFAPDALAPDGAVSRLLLESSKFAAGLSERLRDRIYEDVIPVLATAVADRMGVASLPAADQRAALDEAYHRSMIVLFRLLFVAYAEDRGLLPLDVNEAYTSNALKTLGRRILDDLDAGFSTTSTSMWTDLTQVWDVIDTGDLEGMGVPAYNGGLFTRDPAKNESGAATYGMRLTNDQIGPVLRGLLIDETTDGVLGMVDFRSLSVREFGTIYEGLLASGLGIAETDQAVDSHDTYVPARAGDEIVVRAGTVYFHSRSGSRKATGSYFTKPFAVEHLLDTALEPSLDRHLARVKTVLDAGAVKRAASELFNFRVADLSMGSAHFLVSAVDRIEARFSSFLIENPIPDVEAELDALRQAAATNLGVSADESGIDSSLLLRRQIARRCIYGTDINEIAVELARLGLWIHTFVPGLPLAFLNHGLVWGNALTGVGTLDEILSALAAAEQRETKASNNTDNALLEMALRGFMERAQADLERLGALTDASIADVTAANSLHEEVTVALAPLRGLCDLIVGEYLTRHLDASDKDRVVLSSGDGALFTAADADSLESAVLNHPHLDRASAQVKRVRAVHYPVAFAEVFNREPGGFDVLLGNPPWDKVRFESQQFWVTRDKGLNALNADDRARRIDDLRLLYPTVAEDEAEEHAEREQTQHLAKSAYHLLGTGHYDFAKMFAERFTALLRVDGGLGVVLPQAMLLLGGWAKLRASLVADGRIVAVQCRNAGGWLFDDVHNSTAVVLFSRTPGNPMGDVTILPGVVSKPRFDERWASQIRMTHDEVAELSETHTLPWFSSQDDTAVFSAMQHHRTLGSGSGWITGATDTRWDFSGSGAHKAYAEPIVPESSDWKALKTRHVDAYAITDDPYDKQIPAEPLTTLGKGVESTTGGVCLSATHPTIVYRFPSRNDDSRTLIATALPSAGFLYSTGYAHGVRVNTGTDAVDVLALLGYMNSVVADWWARRLSTAMSDRG